MNEYDGQAWETVIARRESALARSPRRLVPAAIRRRVGEAGGTVAGKARDLPMADEAQRTIRAVVEGGTEGLARLANGSLATGKILKDYRSEGWDVTLISDIRGLDLRTVDTVKPKLDIRYLAAGATSGAAAGVAIAGGEIAALVGAVGGGAAGAAGGAGVGVVPGAGAGAAPGAAVVLAAMAADAAATTLASVRAIFHTAQYYGYDTNAPDERLRALGVLNLATARDVASKQAAYRELDKLVNLLVRNATWKQLDANVVGRIIHKVLKQQATVVTKRKLGSALPVAGIVLGVGFNLRMLSRVTDTAELYYRERFLREKYGISDEDESVPAMPASDEDVIDIPLADVVEEELNALEPPADTAHDG